MDTLTARPAHFYAPANGGKWHAAALITGEPRCGTRTPLSTDTILVNQNQPWASVHPVVCRKCLRLATSPGYTRSCK